MLLTPAFLDEPVPGLERLVRPGWQVNRLRVSQGDRQTRMSAVHSVIAAWVEETLHSDERPISIAGDCCTALGMLAGLQRGGIDPSLIWFDAHGDFNTPETTPSGFLGGMPLAMIAGRGDLKMANAIGLRPLPEERILLTDGRDLDSAESAALADSGVVHLENAEDLLHHPLPEGPLWIHFDADVVSLADSPAQNYPAAGGPTTGSLHNVFRRLADTGRISAVSMSTWNPDLEGARRSEAATMGLLESLVGGLGA